MFWNPIVQYLKKEILLHEPRLVEMHTQPWYRVVEGFDGNGDALRVSFRYYDRGEVRPKLTTPKHANNKHAVMLPK